MSKKAKAYVIPMHKYGGVPYSFSVECPKCPEYPWPDNWKDGDCEAYVITACYCSDIPDDPCEHFERLEAALRHAWVYCRSKKWKKQK